MRIAPDAPHYRITAFDNKTFEDLRTVEVTDYSAVYYELYRMAKAYGSDASFSIEMYDSCGYDIDERQQISVF